MTEPQVSVWKGCYESSWKGLISSESFSHPAKMSRALLERIFDYGRERGYWQEGDLICDPFGGILSTGIIGSYRKYRTISVELEQRFVQMAQANIEKNRKKLELLGCPLPVIVQGDSRHLAEIVRGVLDGMIGSPPYSGNDKRDFTSDDRDKRDQGRGSFRGTDGQIGDMVTGNLDGVVSSPPYADSVNAGKNGIDWEKAGRPDRLEDSPDRYNPMSTGEMKYGDGNGQLGAMREGDVDVLIGAITSPPYADSMNQDRNGIDWTKIKPDYPGRVEHEERIAMHERHHNDRKYGDGDGQIGAMYDGDFDEVVGAVFSPSFSQPETRDRSPVQEGTVSDFMTRAYTVDRQGNTDGNIAALPMDEVDGVISSPPYVSGGHHPDQTGAWKVSMPGYGVPDREVAGYGKQDGQIGQMQEGEIDGVLTSPPFERSLSRDVVDPAARRRWAREHGMSNAEHVTPIDMEHSGARDQEYGQTEGQIGNENKETYWQAVAQVYQQLYILLKPGGVVALVVKDFIRDKQRVSLCDMTVRLLEAIGFVVVERTHALLVKEHGTSTDMFTGKVVTKRVKRVSFFRRLHEKKYPHLAVDYEEVLWAVKPS